MSEVVPLYDKLAGQFDHARTRALMELPYLREVSSRLAPGAEVLDLGCGTGEPIARWFIDAGFRVTGVDGAPAMLALCRARFPRMSWVEADMRALDLGRKFEAIVAWDSFFHLTADDQRGMFPTFQRHAAPGASLLFTSGTSEGTAIGDLFGHPLYHASLDTREYRDLLERHGFEVLSHCESDPACGGHTVWLARAR